MAQRYEVEAWLGGDHGLTSEQVDQFTTAATAIEARYPNPDDQDRRDAALTVAHRLLTEDPKAVMADLADEVIRIRRAYAAARQFVVTLVPGTVSEAGFARQVGMDRQSVRRWLGKSRR